MAVVHFPNLDTLRLTLASGAVPRALSEAPAWYGEDAEGRLWVRIAAPLPRAVAFNLSRLGAKAQRTAGVEPRHAVGQWSEILPLAAEPARSDAALPGSVLIDVREPRQLPALMAEIRRLGARRVGIRWIDAAGRTAPWRADAPGPNADASAPACRALVLIEHPPLYTLLRGEIPGAGRLGIYQRQAPRVWVEMGYRHPLAKLCSPAEGAMVLIRAPRNWERLEDGPYSTGPETLDLPQAAVDAVSESPIEPMGVPLKLRFRGNEEPAEFWVLGADWRDPLQALAEMGDDRLLARLQVAMGVSDAGTIAVLRALPAAGGPPVLVLPALACRSYLRLPNLYVPVRGHLQPLPRRDVARQLFVPDAETIAWLRPEPEGRFAVERMPRDAFRPLADWIAYLAPEEQRLATRTPVARFRVSPFVAEELVLRTVPVPALPSRAAGKVRGRATPPNVATTAPSPAAESSHWLSRLVRWLTPGGPDAAASGSAARVVSNPPVPGPRSTVALPARTADAAESRRRALERQLLQRIQEPDDAARRGLWPELAGIYSRLQRPADAAQAWIHALWDADEPPGDWLAQWVRAEARLPQDAPFESDLESWLRAEPTPVSVRAVTAYTVWADRLDPPPAQVLPLLDPIQRLLEAHEDWLPARAAWMARIALHRLARGDVLGLARARDRLLERLHARGLSVDLDVPPALRFAGEESGDRLDDVRAWLLRARERWQRWITLRVPTALPSPGGTPGASGLQMYGIGTSAAGTQAYADFMLAWGLARLGDRVRSRQLMRAARAALPGDDPVHEVLSEAFAVRIEQALEGRAAGPWPEMIVRSFRDLRDRERRDPALAEQMPAYKADKLRLTSRILEPDARGDRLREVYREIAEDPPREKAWRACRDESDPNALAGEILALLESMPADRQARELGLALHLAPRLGESALRRVLERFQAALPPWTFQGASERVVHEIWALERGLAVAAQSDRADLAPRLLEALTRLFRARSAETQEEVPEIEDALLAVMSQGLRGLRRSGMRDESQKLVQLFTAWALPGGDWAQARRQKPGHWPVRVRRLLLLAPAWFDAGEDERVFELFDEARAMLFAPPGPDRARWQTPLACAYATALGAAPARLALERIDELFQRVQGIGDSLTTNTHYSLSRLRLIEAALFAVVHDHFALGPAVRRWLEDDEFRVRRRIHQETRARLGPAE